MDILAEIEKHKQLLAVLTGINNVIHPPDLKGKADYIPANIGAGATGIGYEEPFYQKVLAKLQLTANPKMDAVLNAPPTKEETDKERNKKIADALRLVGGM